MIDPKQLRIGNCITFPIGLKGKICEVLAINEKQVLIKTDLDRRAWLNLDYLEPIPLTQELLEKCGFEPFLNMLVKGGIGWTEGDSLIQICEGMGAVECTTLHQLQNLYFALTGEELNIKL